MKKIQNSLLLFFFVSIFFAAPTYGFEVTDMRGKRISLDAPPKRIATIDDGFVESILTHIGHIDAVNSIGSWSMKRDYSYELDLGNGPEIYAGKNTMFFLHPKLDDLVCVNSPQGNIINFEALARSNPDIVILRIGDCTLGTRDGENIKKSINMIESLGLPLMVLYAPQVTDLSENPENALASMRQEARIIASLFQKEKEADALMDYVQETEQMIIERTKNIPENHRPKVLYFGLSPRVRGKGGAGTLHGVDTAESLTLEKIIHAKNAFQGKGRALPVSAEQVYALDPDIIFLPTSQGYHPAGELLTASYYSNLRELRAVKEKKVYPLPWSPMNCARRLEYPLELLIIAKATYPQLFADINIADFSLEFYKKIYHVDDKTAKALRSEQILDWLESMNF